MLKQNTTILAQYPFRMMGGLFCGERSQWDQSERRNKFIGEAGWDPTCGVPSGHLAHSSWNLPQKSGGMSAFTTLHGDATVSLSLAGGVSTNASLSGSGDITSAVAQLVISMVASLTGTGTIASADLQALLNAVANLTGSGDVTTAALGALGWLSAATSAGGDITNATPYASGVLSATIRGYSDLTPEGIRDKVWAAALDNGLTAEEMLRIILSATAAKLSGAATTNILIRSVADDKNRIDATVDANGNRTAITLDGSP